MTFADYLEHITAKVKRDLEAPMREDVAEELGLFTTKAHVLDLFTRAHLFNLGEADDIERAAVDLREDLREDFEQGVPAPFSNMIILFQKDGRWGCEWHVSMKPYVEGLPFAGAAKDLRLVVDLGEMDFPAPAFEYMVFYDLLQSDSGLLGIQSYGKATARAMELHGLSRTEAGIALVKGVMPMLERVALVAHPANYIVRTSPKLTPREERRHKEKSELPVRKRPFYIVINHDRLVSLNPANAREGGHRSPVPHARRGHWMELAERCRLARAEGKTRVWLKQVYVGERQFEDEKNRYRVFVDREDLKREG